MRMHARSVAATAGASHLEVGAVVARLADLDDFSVETAKAILSELRETCDD